MKLRSLPLISKWYYQRLYSQQFIRTSTKPGLKPFWVLMLGVTATGGISYYMLRQNDSLELSPTHFTPYKISHKIEIDQDHFLLELSPLKKQKANLWSQMRSEHLWSIEIKQPEIMVARSYTPLPLQIDEKKGELEAIPDGSNGEGRFMLYVKQYSNGEVARWLNKLPLGHTVEVRGPFIEYELPSHNGELSRSRDFLFYEQAPLVEEKFKYQPFDIAMFTAGTGIVSALQLVLTESPLRGKMKLWYCCGNINELGPLKPFLHQLQKYGRIDLHLLESSKESNPIKRLQIIWKQIPSPVEYAGSSKYVGPNKIFSPVLALICGPERYITDIAGPRSNLVQGPIGGMLKLKGWTEENVYKLS